MRLDDGSVNNGPTTFARLMTAAGARYLWQWRLLPGDVVVVEGFGRASTLQVDAEGTVLNVPRPDYPPATVESFCAAWQACYGPQLRILEEDILPRFAASELAAAQPLVAQLAPLTDLR